MACLKLKSLKWPFTRTDRRRNNRVDGLADKLTVNEEYIEALRTKSYTDMFNKVQDQMGEIRSLDRLPSSSSRPFRVRLSDYLFEPRPAETLAGVTKGSSVHHLIIDYLEASYEASNTCELLLGSVHQARANYRIITRAISLPNSTHVFKELSSFASLNNPMLRISSSQYRDIHESLEFLLERLTMEFKKIRRREKFNRYCKRILGFSLMVSCSGLLIALLVISIHSVVGIVVAPSLTCSLGLAKKRIELITKGLKKTSLPERFGAQLEVTAKCVFILINDFDTMSRLVGRLQDEIEHNKAIADMCVRNGKPEVLMEVVREFKIHQTSFLEQLEDLEEHIYLCFLSINRSRMLVMQEVRGLQQEHR
ncbi:UPF0496 protein At1g20180-like [Rhododendron vialii]|uniref:UPF0496 protein At1g20180-like n=1 Tax=Rhododendron vialii TaxID=182163 RepID=UPI00265EC8D3|nr:UPF0496 protein At1g20180-like [Rhododendron vialii]